MERTPGQSFWSLYQGMRVIKRSPFRTPINNSHCDQADQSFGTVSELQARTVEYLRTRHSKDGDDCTSSTTAFYLRDEVSGPLSGAEGKEDESVDLRQEEVWVDKKSGSEGRVMKEELMTPSEQDVRG